MTDDEIKDIAAMAETAVQNSQSWPQFFEAIGASYKISRDGPFEIIAICAEVRRLRKVVDAAVRWGVWRNLGGCNQGGREMHSNEAALFDAVAALAAKVAR